MLPRSSLQDPGTHFPTSWGVDYGWLTTDSLPRTTLVMASPRASSLLVTVDVEVQGPSLLASIQVSSEGPSCSSSMEPCGLVPMHHSPAASSAQPCLPHPSLTPSWVLIPRTFPNKLAHESPFSIRFSKNLRQNGTCIFM